MAARSIVSFCLYYSVRCFSVCNRSTSKPEVFDSNNDDSKVEALRLESVHQPASTESADRLLNLTNLIHTAPSITRPARVCLLGWSEVDELLGVGCWPIVRFWRGCAAMTPPAGRQPSLLLALFLLGLLVGLIGAGAVDEEEQQGHRRLGHRGHHQRRKRPEEVDGGVRFDKSSKCQCDDSTHITTTTTTAIKPNSTRTRAHTQPSRTATTRTAWPSRPCPTGWRRGRRASGSCRWTWWRGTAPARPTSSTAPPAGTGACARACARACVRAWSNRGTDQRPGWGRVDELMRAHTLAPTPQHTFHLWQVRLHLELQRDGDDHRVRPDRRGRPPGTLDLSQGLHAALFTFVLLAPCILYSWMDWIVLNAAFRSQPACSLHFAFCTHG